MTDPVEHYFTQRADQERRKADVAADTRTRARHLMLAAIFETRAEDAAAHARAVPHPA